MKFFLVCFLLTTMVFLTFGVESFKITDQWKFDDEIIGRLYYSSVDKDGHLVGVFYMTGPIMVTPQKVYKFAPRGQGPGELMDIRAMFWHGEDLAFVESSQKIKIFKKNEGAYKIKKNARLKGRVNLPIIQNGTSHKSYWFFAGLKVLNQTQSSYTISQLEILDEEGNVLHDPVVKEVLKKKAKLYHLMKHLLTKDNSQLYMMLENELKVYIISLETLKKVKEKNLEKPGFYQEIQEEFYKPGKGDMGNVMKNIENWRTSYSSIYQLVLEGNHIIVQIRTCSDKHKKFAMLYYNTRTYKLEKTIFTDDLLLGIRDGRYSFHANGDPGSDKEADIFIIKICTLEETNEKK
jgi:hypothetical protein